MSVRTGACAAANGGTLMLDEVGELPLELQSELLRVVQEGMYKRVGSDSWQTQPVPADLRHQPRTWRPRSPPAASGPTSTTGSRRRWSGCRRCATGRRTSSRCSASSSRRPAARPEPPPLAPALERALRCRAYPGNLRDLRQVARRVAARHVGPRAGHPGRPGTGRPARDAAGRRRPVPTPAGRRRAGAARGRAHAARPAGTRRRPGGDADPAGLRRQRAGRRRAAGRDRPGAAPAAGSEPERPADRS